MKRNLFTLLSLLSLTIISFGQEKDIFKQELPLSALLKPTLKVKAVRDLRYWKAPTLDNYWSWMPKVEFAASGPIDDASYFTYEFFTPDGKLWFSHDSKPFAIEEGRWNLFESEAVPSWQDKRSSIATGFFSFKITLKNSLQGTSKLFYQGKFKVSKEFAGTSHPNFKNQNCFYVEQDWMLPMAYLNFDSKIDENAPMFYTNMWFRGSNNGKLKGFLFYNGKKISDTEMGGTGNVESIISEGDKDNKYIWELHKFNFINVRYFDNSSNRSNFHVLKRNKGNYEIKIMLDDEIVRTIPFTIGDNGKIVDSELAKNNGISGFGIIVPANVIPIKEGILNIATFKADAFYSNALQ